MWENFCEMIVENFLVIINRLIKHIIVVNLEKKHVNFKGLKTTECMTFEALTNQM